MMIQQFHFNLLLGSLQFFKSSDEVSADGKLRATNNYQLNKYRQMILVEFITNFVYYSDIAHFI